MSFTRTPVTRLLTAARGETRLALAGASGLAWRLLFIVGWSALAILMGSLFGFAAATLPPMGLVAIIAVVALVLMWVTPDLPTIPDSVVRYMLFAVVVVHLTIPIYYTVQIGDLPWISARRIFTTVLIVLFAITYSTSRESRIVISQVANYNRLIYVCIVSLYTMMFLSIFTSINPSHSASSLIDVLLEWLVPFVATIFVLRKDHDVDRFVRFILWCAVAISTIGVLENFLRYRPYLYFMPKDMLDQLITDNQSFSVLTSEPIRNNQYRSSSVYIVPLSFAEAMAMISPLAVIFLLYGRSLKDKILGAVALFACLAGIYVSHSRGGYLSFLVAAAMFASLFVIRSRLFQPRSLAAPILAVVGAIGFTLVGSAIAFVGRFHKAIFGGGQGAISDHGRWMQWTLGWPKIVANPITGHGLAESGEIVGYYPVPGGTPSVDSYLLTLLVETGVPSVLFFFGIALLAAWSGAQRYLHDRAWAGALSGGLACSIAAFAFYRFFLSQRENQMLFFMLVGCVMVLHSTFVRANERRSKATIEGTRAAATGALASPQR